MRSRGNLAGALIWKVNEYMFTRILYKRIKRSIFLLYSRPTEIDWVPELVEGFLSM